MTTLTKTEFARLWDSDVDGGGIDFDDVADCAIAWGITTCPRSQPVNSITRRVVAASGAKDPFLGGAGQ